MKADNNRKPVPSRFRHRNAGERTVPSPAALTATVPTVRLAPDRERLSRTFHPWVFSGAILDVLPVVPAAASLKQSAPQAALLPGIVRVVDAWGDFVAWGQYHPASKIALRLVEWKPETLPDETWLATRLTAAFALREPFHGGSTGTDALRIVFSEADHLPGFIIDRMGADLVVQSESAVVDTWMPVIAAALPSIARQWIPDLAAIVERSNGDGRTMERLAPRSGRLWAQSAALAGAALPTQPGLIHEASIPFSLNTEGQKTGFYTDQRENRALVARYARGKRVLDICCYSGGFSAYALAAGARALTLLDASADALSLARTNLDRLQSRSFVPCPVETIQGDAFQTLRRLRDDGREESWDLIILDPPKLAPNRQSLDRALAAYKDLNLQAIKLLAPGGYLASFSCSGLVSADDLRQAIAFAAKDAGRQVHILHRLYQAPCHPVLLSFPEGEYLKGFFLRIE